MRPDVKITKRGVKIRKKAFNALVTRHGPEAIPAIFEAAGQEVAIRHMVQEGVPFHEASARLGFRGVAP